MFAHFLFFFFAMLLTTIPIPHARRIDGVSCDMTKRKQLGMKHTHAQD